MTTPCDPQRICKTCRFWDQWLPVLGDCMQGVVAAQEARLRDEEVPFDSAHETVEDHSCDKWQPRRDADR